MTISVGDRLPDANLVERNEAGAKEVRLADLVRGRSVVIFAVPGAFTPTCSMAHVPSFIRTKDRLAAKGVDQVICVSVNDSHVMREWGNQTGATAAGITMLADADAAFAKAVGMDFAAGFANGLPRSKRYALHAVDGVVKVWHPETGSGCEISGGEAMVAAI